jgi:hypothetical protein
MAQIYLLSVLSLLISGSVLSTGFLAEKLRVPDALLFTATNRTARLIIGGVTALVGFLKLFVVAPGESVPIAGDLMPAAAGILLGGILLYDAWRKKGGVEEAASEENAPSSFTYRISFGLAGMLVAILHFLLPGAPIL